MASLSAGSKGAAVSTLQAALNASKALQNSTPLVVDGDYGPLTTAAVKTFQASAGLPADGVAGDATMAALSRAPVSDVIATGARGWWTPKKKAVAVVGGFAALIYFFG